MSGNAAVKNKLMAIILSIFLSFSGILGIGSGIGKNTIVKLDANPSTGCKWSYTIVGKKVVEVTNEFYLPSFIGGGRTGNIGGSGGKEYFVLKALKKGTATVTFRYKSPDGRKTYDKVAFLITVDEDLKITAVQITDILDAVA